VSTLNVNTVEPAGATLTIGASGDTVKANDSVNVNTVKDAGGNTLWVSNGSGVLSSVSGFGDALVLLSTQTASDDASISFTSDIDSEYKEYIFKCINMNPADNDIYFQFQGSTDGGSNYNTTITSSSFTAYHTENGSGAALTYRTSEDQAEGTAFQDISGSVGNDADKSGVMELHLFNPSSTTYVKNWYSKANTINGDANPLMQNTYIAGYFNTTSAIDAVQFKFESGNINEGTIKMYGVK
jgi:hypothetical protein